MSRIHIQSSRGSIDLRPVMGRTGATGATGPSGGPVPDMTGVPAGMTIVTLGGNAATWVTAEAALESAIAGKADTDSVPSLAEDPISVTLSSGSISATTIIPVYVAPFSCRLDEVKMAFGGSVTADNSNYWTVGIRRYRAAAPSTLVSKTTKSATGSAPITAWVDWNYDAIDLTSDKLREGDVLAVVFTKTGTPPALVTPVITFRAPPATFAAPITGASDDFARLAGPGLGVAYSGQTWEVVSGGWEIYGDTARPTSTASVAVVDANMVAAQVQVTVPTFTGASGTFGLVWHSSDVNNQYSTTRTAMFKLEDGVSTNIANFSATFGSGDGIRVTTDGAGTFTVYRNAGMAATWVQVGQATGQTFNLGATKFGIRSSVSLPSQIAFDDFSVIPL